MPIFFQEPKDDEIQLAREVISALCNLENFRDAFDASRDLKKLQKDMDDTSCNIEKVMGNSEKDKSESRIKLKI